MMQNEHQVDAAMNEKDKGGEEDFAFGLPRLVFWVGFGIVGVAILAFVILAMPPMVHTVLSIK